MSKHASGQPLYIVVRQDSEIKVLKYIYSLKNLLMRMIHRRATAMLVASIPNHRHTNDWDDLDAVDNATTSNPSKSLSV